MQLRIGELARRTGLTVRALRHYDDIGLLKPSARSDGGYRLYGRDDVARLYRIQALRRLDVSLAEIGAILADGGADLENLVRQQMSALEREIRQATALHAHLAELQKQLCASTQPSVDEWLVSLESMVAGPKYFSDEEIRKLKTRAQAAPDAARAEKAALTSSLNALMRDGASPEDPQAVAMARRWIDMLLREADGDEATLMKLYEMHRHEPALYALTGIGPAAMRFISHAMAYGRLDLYARHCSSAEMALLRGHYAAQVESWPPLIAEVRQHMRAGTAVDSAELRALADRWQALSLAKAGGDAALCARLQAAFRDDAALRRGSGIDAALIAYVGAVAAAQVPQHAVASSSN